MISITLNGAARELAADVRTVADLVALLGLGGRRVAVEVNREIVRREIWATTPLADGDTIEVLHLVGGGET